MTFKQLAREICKREGKRQQVNIAQVSEILRCLEDIVDEQTAKERSKTKEEDLISWEQVQKDLGLDKPLRKKRNAHAEWTNKQVRNGEEFLAGPRRKKGKRK